ncbi:UBP-type zinc finger domain-containing protein [Streptomyces sp. NPDC048639]|uniref:UBP-type zinc finger domain-containing protein n=1 Tax=Streptomyces sp. NPDC048639 TaxID=3365581 RepID=UPI003710026A
MNASAPDPHLSMVRPVEPRTPEGCEECLRLGSTWVHLRVCLTCGQVGCCDSSPHRHARGHADEAGHPIVASIEPGEDWRWCFVDEALV